MVSNQLNCLEGFSYETNQDQTLLGHIFGVMEGLTPRCIKVLAIKALLAPECL